MRLLTWYDVETKFMENRNQWPKSWNRVDVYNDEVIINADSNINDQENREALKEIFDNCYSEKGIWIEFDKQWIDVVYEEGDESDKLKPVKTPLFQDIGSKFLSPKSRPDLPVPIVAFHSYKGGVGRTLSLISLARAITHLYENKKRLLIIDADLEAPGLTWMLSGEDENVPVSYLDVLSFMQFHALDDELAEKIAGLMKNLTLKIDTERYEIEHYFLPVYRMKSQVMNVFSSLEKIIASQSNKYVAAEFFSKIGAALGADLILIDLRAGITEFSAPFLLDPRVYKYFVSSTSMQSVKGTQLVLEEIHGREPLGLQNAKILLTMIPPEMEEETVSRIEDQLGRTMEEEAVSRLEGRLGRTMEEEAAGRLEDQLGRTIEGGALGRLEDQLGTTVEMGESSNVWMDKALNLREDYLIRVRFDAAFISLGNFQEICAVLKGKELSKIMRETAKSLFGMDTAVELLSMEKIRDVSEKLNDIARKEITAEGSSASNLLATASIREMVKDYRNVVPQIVVLGAKGSGKTYIYKQLLADKSWDRFVCTIEGDETGEQSPQCLSQTLLVPLVSTVNIKYMNPLLKECMNHANEVLEHLQIAADAVHKNYKRLVEYAEESKTLKEWVDIWKDLIIHMFGEDFSSLEQVDTRLTAEHKKAVLLVDGLEDLFMEAQVQKLSGWKSAIRSLTQNIVNELRSLEHGSIGILIFVRSDMAQEAVGVNFAQFQNQYARYELKWTSTEALRLALWIAAKADPVLLDHIDILRSSREVLEERLERLWGKKLGKKDSREAESAKWIIGALSDFSGQLQARDVVRFLQYATENWQECRFTYRDRYLMPFEIKHAIPACSKRKYQEIKDGMPLVYGILKKLETMDENDKKLPLLLDKLILTGEEIARLENQGYLMASDHKYYLPEIIRFALGFQYEKGARPKVLSLMSK